MADIRYPFKNFRYKVLFGGVEAGGFSEVSGSDITVDVVEYREGNEVRTTPRKLAGLTKYGNITLKRGVIGSFEMTDWLLSVASSNTAGPTGIQRKNITIQLLDDTGMPGPSWNIINAWPTHYTAPDLNGMGGEVAVETLELCHEGVEREDSDTENSATPSEN